MKFLEPLVRKQPVSRYALEDYVSWLGMGGLGGSFSYQGSQYPLGLNFTQPNSKTEPIGENFAGYVQHGLRSNGIVWTCATVRLQVFSQARFLWQRLRSGKPGDLFGTSALNRLERPWMGGTTGDLLGQMILHADFAGNAYVYSGDDGDLGLLRPDWTDIVLEQRFANGGVAGFKRAGYVYFDGGQRDRRPTVFLPDEVAHFAPSPDPMASFRGMSWLTPIISDLTSDKAANRHRLNVYENAATPNLAVSLAADVSPEAFDAFVERMNANHKGVQNAGKTLFLGGGADVKVVGASLHELDFKAIQGASETRVAAASGVGAIIAQFSEGMQGSSLNAGNYGAARRRFSDIPLRHLWQNVSGSLETLIPPPTGARLWYDASDIAFLQEDAKDAADIWAVKAQAIRTLTDGGYTPESVMAATAAEDETLLVHTGKLSVQLQPPSDGTPTMNGNGSTPAKELIS